MKDLEADVWPEFLHFVGHGVPHEQHAEGPGILPEGAIVWSMVDIGESCSRSTSGDFGNIEALISRVRASNEELMMAW